MVVNYFLNTRYLSSNFKVPNAIVDEYIRSADGDALKVLLIILRDTFEVPTLEQISLSSGLSIESVQQALKFWQDKNIIYTSSGSDNKSFDMKDYKPEFLSPSTIMQLSESSKDIRDIINVAQSMSGNKALSPYDISSLISAYNYLNMPKDVILALYSDCKLNNNSMNFFDVTISRWASLGVKSLDDANKQLHTEHYLRQVANIFGLKNLLPTQRNLVVYWSANEYPLEIVKYLFDKYNVPSKDNIQQSKANIYYINKIVTEFIGKGINTLEKVKNFENTHKAYDFQDNGNNSSNKSHQDTSFDLEEWKRFASSTRRIMHD